MFVRPDSVVSRICFPTAPKRLLQQYLPIADLGIWSQESLKATKRYFGRWLGIPLRAFMLFVWRQGAIMGGTRKIAAILAADVVGFSRLTGADEDRTLARLRALRSDLNGPTVSVHHGRVVKRTGDEALIEFRSVVDAVRCADRSAERHGRAQRRPAAGAPHRAPLMKGAGTRGAAISDR